jgi:hypothetical protein
LHVPSLSPPESVRAPKSPTVRESSINSSAPVSFRARSTSAAVMDGSGLGLALRHVKMMDEIALRRKRRSDAALSVWP